MEVAAIGLLIIILVIFIGLKSFNILKEDKLKLENELNALRISYMNERDKVIKSEENLIAQREKQAQQELYITELQQRFKMEFENIANKLLEEKSAKFSEHNRTHLDIILNPLKENIKAFEEKVEKVYKS